MPPRIDMSAKLLIQMTPDLREALDQAAALAGKTLAESVRDAIRLWLSAQLQPPDA